MKALIEESQQNPIKMEDTVMITEIVMTAAPEEDHIEAVTEEDIEEEGAPSVAHILGIAVGQPFKAQDQELEVSMIQEAVTHHIVNPVVKILDLILHILPEPNKSL
jgi:hypothetical protein